MLPNAGSSGEPTLSNGTSRMTAQSSKGGAATGGQASQRLESCLAAIDTWQEKTKGFITLMTDAAREDARRADAATAAGKWLGLLHGMPIAIKDNLDTAGVRTTSGSLFFNDHVPNGDAPLVARLRRAGAVLVGKATMHEVAFGARSFNPVIGQARNPYDLARVPGGSSGGSGIAVATGMAEAAIGTDTGGSIRLPSAINGITGLRPTHGRVSNRGCLPVSLSHDTAGPMARTAADCARIFAVIAGYDPEDPTSEDRPLENFLPTLGDGIAGMRIGVPRNFYLDGCSPDVLESYRRSLKTLESLGARLVDVTVPGVEGMQREAEVVIYSDACQLHADRMGDVGRWGAQTIERMRTGLAFTGRDYARAMRARETWKRTLAGVFQQVDILASPTMVDEPPLIEDGRSLQTTTLSVTKNTYCGAFGYLPGLSLPNGMSRNGLPLALQLEAAWWQEPLLLRAGHAFQSVTDWHEMRPKAVA
jgi:aspartyl-tRNA(Asn)/glutamyl-tRNA(Gln) amidotransferase subunit A